MLKKNRLYNMDCISFLQELDSASVDLVVSSPPYNIGIDYDSWDDLMPWNDYIDWCTEWMKECYRVLKDDGRICINHYLNFNGGIEKEDQFPLFDFRDIQENIGFNPSKLVI